MLFCKHKLTSSQHIEHGTFFIISYFYSHFLSVFNSELFMNPTQIGTSIFIFTMRNKDSTYTLLCRF
jgi:hypothetical protein